MVPEGRGFSRPLRSRFDGWLDGEGPDEGEKDDAQNHPQPGEEEAKVITDGAEDGIGGVAGAAFEIATAEMTFCLHVADHRLDGGATSELALMCPNTPRFWPEMKTRRGFAASWPRYPLSA